MTKNTLTRHARKRGGGSPKRYQKRQPSQPGKGKGEPIRADDEKSGETGLVEASLGYCADDMKCLDTKPEISEILEHIIVRGPKSMR